MSSICDADLHHLKPGKKVVLKSYNGSVSAPTTIAENENYWRLIGAKAIVSKSILNERVLITFACDLQHMGLICDSEPPNSLWILPGDLKFVCRY